MLVIEELRKVRKVKLEVRNMGQSKDIMKMELAKGLPNRESHEIMNRSMNVCSSDHEYLHLLFDKIKDMVVSHPHTGMYIPLFKSDEIQYLKDVVNKAKDFENRIVKTGHKVERSLQIPIVIQQ